MWKMLSRHNTRRHNALVSREGEALVLRQRAGDTSGVDDQVEGTKSLADTDAAFSISARIHGRKRSNAASN